MDMANTTADQAVIDAAMSIVMDHLPSTGERAREILHTASRNRHIDVGTLATEIVSTVAREPRPAPPGVTGSPAAGQGLQRVVSLPAAIDMVSSPISEVKLASALAAPGVVTVIGDMTATTFCDCQGARMLAHTHARAAARETDLRLAGPSAWVRRLFGLLDLDKVLHVYPELDAALRAAG